MDLFGDNLYYNFLDLAYLFFQCSVKIVLSQILIISMHNNSFQLLFLCFTDINYLFGVTHEKLHLNKYYLLKQLLV